MNVDFIIVFLLLFVNVFIVLHYGKNVCFSERPGRP